MIFIILLVMMVFTYPAGQLPLAVEARNGSSVRAYNFGWLGLETKSADIGNGKKFFPLVGFGPGSDEETLALGGRDP